MTIQNDVINGDEFDWIVNKPTDLKNAGGGGKNMLSAKHYMDGKKAECQPFCVPFKAKKVRRMDVL